MVWSYGKTNDLFGQLNIFSDHNTMRLEINDKKKNCKKHKHMETKQYATKQPMDHWRNQEEAKKYLDTDENENKMIQKSTGHSKSSSNREVYSDASLPQETRKI